MMGDIKEDFEANGSPYNAVDGHKQTLQCVSWQNISSCMIARRACVAQLVTGGRLALLCPALLCFLLLIWLVGWLVGWLVVHVTAARNSH